MTDIGNHDLKFQYTKTDIFFVRPNGQTYEVCVDGMLVGFVEKGGGGHEGYSPDKEFASFRTGPRKYAAEHLAHLAGLLDANYNAT